MKYGIYYAYWEHEWGGSFLPYIEKVKKLGFDILEVATANFHKEPDDFFYQLKAEAERENIVLTGGYGPDSSHNIASKDVQIIRNTMVFYETMFQKMQLANIRKLGGGLYGYWPADYTKTFDKKEELENSIHNMKELADMAASYHISLGMEVLNRFEGYLLNTCEEAVSYVEAVNRDNVYVMLDTFHMNIEEESIPEAIRRAGKYLGHIHVGEANRKPPHNHGRINWKEIGEVLQEIGYDGDVVMEPFVLEGGQVGNDIRIWRDLSEGGDEAALDKAVAESVLYLRNIFK